MIVLMENRLVVSFLFVLAFVATGARANERNFIRKRKKAQQQRQKLRRHLNSRKKQLAQKAKKAIEKLIEVAKTRRPPGAKHTLKKALQGYRRLHPADRGAGAGLAKTISSVSFEEPGTDVTEKQWTERVRRVFYPILEELRQILRRLNSRKIYTEVYDFVRIVLSFDPENRYFRRKLGQVKYRGKWMSEFKKKRLKKGLEWDAKYGWILKGKRERYEDGKYFDLQRRSWTTMEEANQYYSSTDEMWKLRTEHFLFRGTAKRSSLVRVAERLEEFYDRIFVKFSNLFTSLKRVENPFRLVFGKLNRDRPFRIYFLRNKKQYLRLSGASEHSVGSYVPTEKASYFYGNPGGTMYHEFVHQLLSEVIGRHGVHAWLEEGIATYAEAPVFAQTGEMILGDFLRHRELNRFLGQVKHSNHMPIKTLLGLRNQHEWKRVAREEDSNNYRSAGAFTWYCMEVENHRYRKDFLDFARNQYQGGGQYSIWEYLGMTEKEFYQNYDDWIAQLKEQGSDYFQQER